MVGRIYRTKHLVLVVAFALGIAMAVIVESWI
jgi:hypothetical protein